MTFKVGAKVRAVKGDPEWSLVKGQVYEVAEVNDEDGNIKLVGLKSRWLMDRFVTVNP